MSGRRRNVACDRLTVAVYKLCKAEDGMECRGWVLNYCLVNKLAVIIAVTRFIPIYEEPSPCYQTRTNASGQDVPTGS